MLTACEESEQEERCFSRQALAQLEYFQELRGFFSDKEVETLVDNVYSFSKEACIRVGTVIFTQSRKADYGFFVLEGSVALLTTSNRNSEMEQKQTAGNKLSDTEKRHLIADELDIKPSQIHFPLASMCPGSCLELRVVDRVRNGGAFGISELLETRVRAFTAITTTNVNVLMIHKKQFQQVQMFEQRRQEVLATRMARQFPTPRAKEFFMSLFPGLTRTTLGFNQSLYAIGDRPTEVYFMEKGEVELCSEYHEPSHKTPRNLRFNSTPREHHIAISKRSVGSFVGMQEVVLMLNRREVLARTTQTSVIYRIQVSNLMEVVDQFPDFNRILKVSMNESLQSVREELSRRIELLRSGFKGEEEVNSEDRDKLMRSLHRQLLQDWNSKERRITSVRLKGRMENLNPNLYEPSTISSKMLSSRLNAQQESQSGSKDSRMTTHSHSRAPSFSLRKTTKTTDLDSINLQDEKANKKVLNKSGAYHKDVRPSSQVSQQFKNNSEPVVEEVVRKHNTFLNRLDPRKRKEFVVEKYKATIEEEDRKEREKGQNYLVEAKSVERSCNARSMKKGLRRFQQSIDQLQSPKEERNLTHKEKVSKIECLMSPWSVLKTARNSHDQGRSLDVQRRKLRPTNLMVVPLTVNPPASPPN